MALRTFVQFQSGSSSSLASSPAFFPQRVAPRAEALG